MRGDRAGSLTSAIQGQCGRQEAGRQAGEQLHYGIVTAGSAEGEAPAPILMSLHAAQEASARRRAGNHQMLPENIASPGGNQTLTENTRTLFDRKIWTGNNQRCYKLQLVWQSAATCRRIIQRNAFFLLFYNLADDAKAEMLCQRHMIILLSRRNIRI